MYSWRSITGNEFDWYSYINHDLVQLKELDFVNVVAHAKQMWKSCVSNFAFVVFCWLAVWNHIEASKSFLFSCSFLHVELTIRKGTV